jgi:hypothetical protein
MPTSLPSESALSAQTTPAELIQLLAHIEKLLSLIGPLLERHSELQLTDRGVQREVSDAAGLASTEALLRRRLDLERFRWQLRVASP